MGHAFDIHNEIGRFLDEKIYQSELAERVTRSNLDAMREVSLHASHKSFSKDYYIDLLVNRSSIYELKTADSLNGHHHKQTIHYLLLANLRHGKIINFRPGSVESKFVSTTLDLNKRRSYSIDQRNWINIDDFGEILKNTLCSLLDDWGTCLEANLYREALLHLLKFPDGGLVPVEIHIEGRLSGRQRMCLLTPTTAWHLSAIHKHFQSYENHILRLLQLTRLKAIHWINLNNLNVTLKTLRK